jgi:hypothetical protein
MKHVLGLAVLVAWMSGCATPDYNDHEGLRATQAMTDMDGKPIDPGPTSGLDVGVGIGIGRFGGRSGFGMGFGMGF